MDNKLTLEIAMKYPNARIIRRSSITNKVVGKFDNIMDWICKHTSGIQEYYGESFEANCKLQLRKLESLTEEEENERDKLYDEGMLKQYGGRLVTDYLRSISVDIDGLIESGVAEEVR